MLNIPYLLMRESKKLNTSAGFKNMSVIGILDEGLSSNLLVHVGKCSIEIPQVVDVSFSIFG